LDYSEVAGMRTFSDGSNGAIPNARDARLPTDDLPQAVIAAMPRSVVRIPVKSVNRIVILQVREIVRLEAEDNYVRIWTDRPYLHKETLTGLLTRLEPATFLRVHRSHAVNIGAVRELRPLPHGEYLIILGNGTELTSGRSYRPQIQAVFGLGRGVDDTT
jgi:DNA-binding LytR/AlgR family response regulator